MDPSYHSGFGNHFQSEALPGSLPSLGNSPQQCPKGLYAELLSGTLQSASRRENQCTWMYRIHPSVAAYEWVTPTTPLFPLAIAPLAGIPSRPTLLQPDTASCECPPEHFLASLRCLGGGGDALLQRGYRIYTFRAGRDMSTDRCAMCNADGSLLLAPHDGTMRIQTELGILIVNVGDIAVIPRGISFSVDGVSSGFVVEAFEGLFTLPDQGVMGTSGLASARDFQHPAANFIDDTEDYLIYHKLGSVFHVRKYHWCVFDVVAWHGTYAPYKYSLTRYCAVNTVTFDHMDPCIGTLLSVFDDAKAHSLSFIVFVPQRRVAVNTFRPPNLHRNCMMEFLAVVRGVYEARPDLVGVGGATLHNTMTPHGPFPEVYERFLHTSQEVSEPCVDNLSVMVEARLPMSLTHYAMGPNVNDATYASSWRAFPKLFT